MLFRRAACVNAPLTVVMCDNFVTGQRNTPQYASPSPPFQINIEGTRERTTQPQRRQVAHKHDDDVRLHQHRGSVRSRPGGAEHRASRGRCRAQLWREESGGAEVRCRAWRERVFFHGSREKSGCGWKARGDVQLQPGCRRGVARADLRRARRGRGCGVGGQRTGGPGDVPFGARCDHVVCSLCYFSRIACARAPRVTRLSLILLGGGGGGG